MIVVLDCLPQVKLYVAIHLVCHLLYIILILSHCSSLCSCLRGFLFEILRFFFYRFLILFIEAGSVYSGTNTVGENESTITSGSEVDLRSGEREKRTLHWVVNGVTQKVFSNKLPSNVRFGVCISSFIFEYSCFHSY